MYDNVYLPVSSIQDAPVKTGGLCSIKIFRWQDVLAWPVINPLTGVMDTAVTLKEGSFIYSCPLIDETRSFEEEQKEDASGHFFSIIVKGNAPGSNAANILDLQTMIFHRWGIIAEDRNGVTRLIGNEDSGASLSFKYSSGTNDTSRKTELIFSWEHSQPAPIYSAFAFDIVIGGVHITAGCLKFIQRFKVGQASAPMDDGDITLINSLFVNKNLLVLASGIVVPVEDGSETIDWGTDPVIRHIEKLYASDTVTFVGSATLNEIIEVYAWT